MNSRTISWVPSPGLGGTWRPFRRGVGKRASTENKAQGLVCVTQRMELTLKKNIYNRRLSRETSLVLDMLTWRCLQE